MSIKSTPIRSISNLSVYRLQINSDKSQPGTGLEPSANVRHLFPVDQLSEPPGSDNALYELYAILSNCQVNLYMDPKRHLAYHSSVFFIWLPLCGFFPTRLGELTGQDQGEKA